VLRIATFISCVMFVALWSGWQPAAQTEAVLTAENIRQSINSWHEIAHIDVDPPAVQAVIEGFMQQTDLITAAAKLQPDFLPSRGGGPMTSLIEALVHNYLYNVRDMKIAASKSSLVGSFRGGSDQHKVYVNSFQLSDPKSTVNKIQVDDIKGYWPTKFLDERGSVLKGPSGMLDVRSRPEKARIVLDGKKATPHFTNTTTIETAGDHNVRVVDKPNNLDCSGTVYIQQGKVATFTCP
jgi:hypothetical protein